VKMSRRYFLVLKGRIVYDRLLRCIFCYGEYGCLTINLRKVDKVTTRGSTSDYCGRPHPVVYEGDELLANGERYWIRMKR
jgi:hypothetical protein